MYALKVTLAKHNIAVISLNNQIVIILVTLHIYE